jgi:predicted secreted Zn-dependent protease
MIEQTRTKLGTISIGLALIPLLALIAFIIINPSCNSPLSQLKEVTFSGSAVSFLFSIIAVVRDRPKKRAIIGLSISSVVVIGLLALFIFIISAVASGSADVEIFDYKVSPPKIEEPGVFISLDTKYYDISGSTEKELNAQIASLGPNGYAAYTASSFNWSFDFKDHDGVCSINHVRIETLITFTYPRWKDTGSDRKLVQGWYSDLAVLENHERGHEEIARKTSQDMYEYLHMLLPPYQSCTDLKHAANALAEAILEESRKKDLEYDRVTDHGRLQTAEVR